MTKRTKKLARESRQDRAAVVKVGAIVKSGQQQRRTATHLNDIDVSFNLLKLLSTCLAAMEEGSVTLQKVEDSNTLCKTR